MIPYHDVVVQRKELDGDGEGIIRQPLMPDRDEDSTNQFPQYPGCNRAKNRTLATLVYSEVNGRLSDEIARKYGVSRLSCLGKHDRNDGLVTRTSFVFAPAT